MAKGVRDWQEDMDVAVKSRNEAWLVGDPIVPEIPEVPLIYWLQQYAAEKERADTAEHDRDRNYMWYLRANEKLQAAEAREKKLRETLEFIKGITTKAPAFTDSAYAHFEASETLASLYPKEEEAT